ncbi:dTMP kinase [Methylococcus capsulatus]|mgnify:CR=1 FL=1|uniref:dTMP kinase n=1 Tax=Methylococcus capsulatus TaxID=414 RepID=UPI001C52EF97|nr:dTMP kinase [Methylococcus capsulatus]QXP87381.1 dTMP kinase [Methylococcus capsulatus]QXP92878.1 dTMP kinase [Methylococcus capsulatus]UQN12383.1 dTMP kinase [Methylococcus capsulatus]
MTPGKFITLEGGEGVGKSTNVDFVVSRLRARGLKVVATREPGGTAFGEAVREIFLRQDTVRPEAELLLLFAARVHHLREVIEPALRRGDWVVCDRFTDASYAYQGAGRGIAPGVIDFLRDWIQAGLRPDLTLLLDAPVDTGLKRAHQRSGPDRLEREDSAFFARVREGYLALARAEPGRIRVINADRPLALVQTAIATQVDSLLAAHV